MDCVFRNASLRNYMSDHRNVYALRLDTESAGRTELGQQTWTTDIPIGIRPILLYTSTTYRSQSVWAAVVSTRLRVHSVNPLGPNER